MIKVALVDDHKLLRNSLGILIEMLQGFQIILQADNGKDFISQLEKGLLPDIALVDITMPVMDGIETTLYVTKHYPDIKVLALSMIRNDLIVIRMLKNGARGYILKDCEPLELKNALHDVFEKGYYYNELFTPLMKAKERHGDEVYLKMLNEQEITFLRWACSEKTHKEIAIEMGLSHRTIDGYRDSLLKKLNLTSRVGLVLFAMKAGIVQT